MSALDDNSAQKLEWAAKHPFLCIYPWEVLEFRAFVDATSDIAPLRPSCCCNLNVKDSADITFTKLKSSMNSGILPVECSACKFEEQTGGMSERIRCLLSKDLATLQKFEIDRSVDFFELRIVLNNICNLSCRSCEASSSSTYASITKDTSTISLNKDIVENSYYFDQIKELINTKSRIHENIVIHLSGGEPLLAKGLYKIIDWLIDNNFENVVKIRLTTSLSVTPSEEFLHKLNKFKEVEFVLSIDSVGSNYHYVRWPAKFEKIERNLQTIIDFKKTFGEPTSFQYTITPVFTLNNIFYIEDYLDYWYRWCNNNVLLFFTTTSTLERTNYLDIQALPTKYRPNLKTLLQKCLTHPILQNYVNELVVHLRYFIIKTIDQLDTLPFKEILWERYLVYTAEFDSRTNTQFAILNQKLYNLLSDSDLKYYHIGLKKADPSKTLKLPF